MALKKIPLPAPLVHDDSIIYHLPTVLVVSFNMYT